MGDGDAATDSAPGRHAELLASSDPYHAGVARIAVDGRCHSVVLTGGSDGSLSLSDVRALARPPQATMAPATGDQGGTGHASGITGVGWLPEDDRLFVSGGDSHVKVWDATDPSTCVTSFALNQHVHATAITAGPPASVAVAVGDNTVRILDLRTGKAVGAMQGHTSPPLCVLWGAPGSSHLFSGGKDGTIRAWDARMGARSLFLFDVYGNEEGSPPLSKWDPFEEARTRSKSAFQKAGRPKLTMEMLRGVRVNPYMGTDAARAGHTGRTFSQSTTVVGAVSPTEEAPETEGERRQRERWNQEVERKARHFLEPPRRTHEYEAASAHRGAVLALAGAVPTAGLRSLGVDGRVRTWDSATGRPVAGRPEFAVEASTLERGVQLHAEREDRGARLALPEGERVAVHCTRTGELQYHLCAHTAEVLCVADAGRGLEILSGGADGRVLRWRLDARPDVPRDPGGGCEVISLE